MPARSRSHTYLFAATAVVAASAARLMLHAWVSDALPLLTFFVAVIAASAYGGFGPGALAAALSTLAAYWLVPSGWLTIGSASGAGALARFLFVSVVIAWLNDRLIRARTVQERLAAIVESSEDSILGLEVNGRITSWNRGAERLYGYTAQEAVGQPMTLVIPPEAREKAAQALARVQAGERVEQFESVRVRKDGSRLDVSITMSPIKNPSGRIVGASKIARDITERRRALADAVAARDRLAFLADISALLTSSLDYQETLDRAVHLALPRLGDFCNVLVEDEHGQLRHVAWGHIDRDKEPVLREVVRRVLAAPANPPLPTFAAVVMKTVQSVVVNREAFLAAMAKVAQTVDAEMLKLSEALRPYAYVGVPLLARGRAIGVMSFGTSEQESRREYSDADVTLIEEFGRRVSTAIENARLFRQADELNRLKDEFLATLSHELRTPLSAILGWARMLSGKQLDEQRVARAIEAIERNAQAQSKIVDDILDVARGMAGNLRLEVKPVDLVNVAHRGVEAIAPAAAAKRIDVSVAATGPVAVAGDAGRLQQVVWNLLSNAVKFTNPGGRVSMAVTASGPHAELSVTDTGIGIAPAFIPFVFDKFRQADGSYSRQQGGLGLGLAIARHLTELHGGSIEAFSDGEGRGATFTVRLPISSDASAGATTA